MIEICEISNKLLNKEILELVECPERKHIEEMAVICCGGDNICNDCFKLKERFLSIKIKIKDRANYCQAYCYAEKLYNAGYRKIPEGSVVLSKEEKQKLLKEMYEQGKFDALADLEKDGKVVLSKEEYEKIKSLYDCGTGYMTSSIGDLPLTVEGLRKAVDEIARLNRVEAELQELNVKYYNETKDLRRELKQTRKETAKEILKELWHSKLETTIEVSSKHNIEDIKIACHSVVDLIREKIKEIAKQFGVEVEE